MHSQPLHQGLRQGQGEAGYDAQDPAVQGVRGRGLREAGVQLQGYVSDLHVVIRAQPFPPQVFRFPHSTYASLMTFLYCCLYIPLPSFGSLSSFA